MKMPGPKYLCLGASLVYLGLGMLFAEDTTTTSAMLASSNAFLVGYFVLEAVDGDV